MAPIGRHWHTHLADLFAAAHRSLVVAAPYVSDYGVRFLAEHLTSGLRQSGAVTLVTDLSPLNVAQGATEVGPLLRLREHCVTVRVVHVARLHCKVYVADETRAIVTSGNLTRGGLLHNFEYGVQIEDVGVVHRVRQDVIDYSLIGTELDEQTLGEYASYEERLRDAARLSTIKAREDSGFDEAIAEARSVLLRPYSTNEAVTSVFERTVLYVLRREGPLTTPELHERIQAIHPELCDEADRIIEGYNYGRKWKHAVRTAQQHLKRRGAVRLTGTHWDAT